MNVSQLIVNVNSTDPNGLLAFYRDVIGVKPHPDVNRESTLKVADTELVFDNHSEITGAAKEPARTMLNFMTDDVVATQQRLETKGVRFLGPPSEDHIRFATFVDPDGNYGQFFSMPGVPVGTEGFAVMRHSGDDGLLREFHRNVVGLSDDHPDLGSPFIAGGTSIYMGPHSEVSGKSAEPARFILNFFIDDIAGEQKRLEGKGVKFIRSQGREYWGGVISTFADPDGNYLQLIQFKPE